MFMRKIFIILMLLPCFSCTDWLNVESEKSVTYLNYFKSESDLEKVLISIFGYEKHSGMSGCFVMMRGLERGIRS